MNKKILSSLLCGAMVASMLSTSVFATEIKLTEDGGSSQVPVELTQVGSTFSVTVPTSLPVHMAADGTITVSEQNSIINNSYGPVEVKAVSVIPNAPWELVDFNTEFTMSTAGQTKFGFQMNGVNVTPAGVVDHSTFGVIDGQDSIDFTYDANVAYQEVAVSSAEIANVVFTIGWHEVSSNTTEVNNASDLVDALTNGSADTVKLTSDIALSGGVEVNRTMTLDLAGYTISAPADTAGDGVFHVVSGGTLVIDGEGTIDAVGNSDYSMAIWADGGTVVINSGTYTNIGAGSQDQYDLIYAKNGGTVVINGGTFECQTPRWTLNNHNTLPGSIIVKGGTFVGYNPAESYTDELPEGAPYSFVATGYTSVENNGSWTVVAE